MRFMKGRVPGHSKERMNMERWQEENIEEEKEERLRAVE